MNKACDGTLTLIFESKLDHQFPYCLNTHDSNHLIYYFGTFF